MLEQPFSSVSMSSASAQLIGQTINGRYQLQSLLGQNAGRQTFLATDLCPSADIDAEPQVVVKLFLFGLASTWESFKLFEREVATIQALEHPSIPTYIDAFETETDLGKGFALVQTYVPCQSLRDWMATGRRFTEADLVQIATAMLRILADLHALQPPVIHRDIKPSNILLGDRSGNSPGQVFLVDFGSVQAVDSGSTRTVVGTYGYMPLEQFGGRAISASDLYSLGATLIYLATGQHPADLPQKTLRIDFASQVSLSQPLVNWLTWLTDPDVAQRPQSAAAALERLQSLDRHNLSPTQPPAAAPFQHIAIRATPDRVDIDLPHGSMLKTKPLIFNHRRQSAVEIATGCGCFLYILLVLPALVVAGLNFQGQISFVLKTFLFWYPLLWGLSSATGAIINRVRQLKLNGYRLSLETRDGKKYISLLGVSPTREIDTDMVMAVPTRGTYELYQRQYKFTFWYRNRNPKSSSSRFAILLNPTELETLTTALKHWHEDLEIENQTSTLFTSEAAMEKWTTDEK